MPVKILFNKYVITVWLFFLICTQQANAQGVVRGIVTEWETGQAMQMATVTLEKVGEEESDTFKGTTTDGNGLYQFNDIAEGEYLFMVRYIGFQAYTDTLQITASNQNITRNVRLQQASAELGQVTVSGAGTTDLKTGQTSIRPEDFGRAPTPGGSADLVNYLQTRPGVVATGDRGGQLFVRGGTPSENMVLMDGTMIYQPFHIVGFFSVFPEDVVSNVDFYAGGFPARYSGRTSSVMDVKLKNGNLYTRNWSASLSPFVSDFFFETPIEEGESSLMISLRGSLIEGASKQYLAETQPLRFNSQLLKYSNSSGEGLSCSALLMRTYDRGQLDFESGDYFKWSNLVTGGRCAGASAGSKVSFVEINFGLSNFSNEAGGRRGGNRSSRIFKSHVDVNFTQFLGKWRLDYGFFTNYRTVDYDISNLFISLDEKEQSFLTTGAFVTVGIPLGDKLSLEPGVSFNSYLDKVPSSAEPRIQFSWNPRGKTNEEIHGAVGIYRQPIIGLSDYRDAGTAFAAWMLLPDKEELMEARHALLGWRQPVGRVFSFSVEGYLKDIKNIPIATWSTVAQFSTDLAYANGSVHGIDVRFDVNVRNVYMSAGYGYSETEYTTAQEHFGTWFGEPIQKFHPPHDRRHQLNAQAGFEIGNFKASISWMYGSGFPFTRPIGFDSYFSFEERPPDVISDFGEPRLLLDKPFGGKMPDFHRLDVSAEQKVSLETLDVNIQVGAINTYDWNNLFYYDVFNQEGIRQLPLMPYVSLKVGTKG